THCTCRLSARGRDGRALSVSASSGDTSGRGKLCKGPSSNRRGVGGNQSEPSRAQGIASCDSKPAAQRRGSNPFGARHFTTAERVSRRGNHGYPTEQRSAALLQIRLAFSQRLFSILDGSVDRQADRFPHSNPGDTLPVNAISASPI